MRGLTPIPDANFKRQPEGTDLEPRTQGRPEHLRPTHRIKNTPYNETPMKGKS